MLNMDKQEAVKYVARIAATICAGGEQSVDQAVAKAVEIVRIAEKVVEEEYGKKEEKKQKK
jgi:hypothetical protein